MVHRSPQLSWKEVRHPQRKCPAHWTKKLTSLALHTPKFDPHLRTCCGTSTWNCAAKARTGQQTRDLILPGTGLLCTSSYRVDKQHKHFRRTGPPEYDGVCVPFRVSHWLFRIPSKKARSVYILVAEIWYIPQVCAWCSYHAKCNIISFHH